LRLFHLSAFPLPLSCQILPSVISSHIHPTAVIDPAATIGNDVRIGPYSVIDGLVQIADGCRIDGHVSLRGNTQIGPDCNIGWGAVVGADPQDLHFNPSTDSGVIIGRGNTLREYVTIHRSSAAGGNTIIGEGNFLMTGVHLAHDVIMGNHNVLANNVLLAGHIQVGDKTFLGGGAVFHQFIRIGNYAIVQGNSAISQDVPPYCLAHGHNHLSGLNIIGLKRAGFSPELRAEIKRVAKQLLFSGNLTTALAQLEKTQLQPQTNILISAVSSPSRKGILTGKN
jgi:UDP-N-acetylglucosamine acyltransferase